MTNDELNEPPVDFEESPDGSGPLEDFEGGGTTLGDMWRNNPLIKIGAIAGGLITVIGAVILFGGGGKEAPLPSRVKGAENVKEAPGQGPVSEAYREAVEEATVQRTEEALRTGGSVLPTPIDSPVSRLELPEDKQSLEDPLERWRRIQEERQRQASQKAREETVTVDPNADAIEALATAMAGQMEGILSTKKPMKPMSESITAADYAQKKREEEAQKLQEMADQKAESDGAGKQQIVDILIPAGTIEYGQLILEANSDIKDGPVLAYLASGPLAGAKLIGSYKAEEEYLVLTFDVIVIDGISHKTDAIALDPDTTLPALATDVDHRYFSRVILPAAASFVEGLGEAIADSGSTTVVVDGGAAVESDLPKDTREEFFSALSDAGAKVGEILDEDSKDTKTLVRVEAGTPMGILFISPVTDETSVK